MPISSQIFSPHIPVHVILRSSNSRPCFYTEDDYRFFLKRLQEYTIESSCSVHAYVLMSNHVHLLLTPAHEKSTAALIKFLGELYTHYVSRTYRKNGSLLGKKFSCHMIPEEKYFLVCQRYIELNPVRAGIVSFPGEYPWSSYRVNAYGVNSGLISRHPSFLLLGNSKVQRMEAYRDLFDDNLPSDIMLKMYGMEGSTSN